VTAAALIIAFVGFFALWTALAIVIRKGLRGLATTSPPTGTTRGVVVRRYLEWGEDFVSFLVYWLGGALFMAVLGGVFLATGHLWWFALAMLAMLLSFHAIAAAVKHGKATPRNIWRVLTRS
jgi:hypothetical protein